MQLSREDLEFLLECVDAKEGVMAQGDVIGDMLDSLLKREEKPDVERMRAQQLEKQRLRDRERKPIRERCILVKAKLLQMRDSLDADKLLHEASSAWGDSK